jgi:hypothetical protein
MSEQTEQEKNQEKADKLRFHYIKSNHFRVIHADGAWGGLTPRLEIHMAVYSERPAIPDVIEQEINADQSLGSETAIHGRDGVIREVEADLVMSFPTAKALHAWLGQMLGHIEKLVAESQSVEPVKEGVK